MGTNSPVHCHPGWGHRPRSHLSTSSWPREKTQGGRARTQDEQGTEDLPTTTPAENTWPRTTHSLRGEKVTRQGAALRALTLTSHHILHTGTDTLHHSAVCPLQPGRERGKSKSSSEIPAAGHSREGCPGPSDQLLPDSIKRAFCFQSFAFHWLVRSLIGSIFYQQSFTVCFLQGRCYTRPRKSKADKIVGRLPCRGGRVAVEACLVSSCDRALDRCHMHESNSV